MRRWFGSMATRCAAAWKARRVAACFWPGLPQLWYDGSWRGLAVAAAFGGLLNALVAVSLVWHELATTTARLIGWLVLVGVWLAAAMVSWRSLARGEGQNGGDSRPAAEEDLYPAAVNEYLKRNFVAAERLARKLLDRNGRDIPASLMLASVWRRTGRTTEAKAELERASRLEASRPWSLEIERELARLKKPETAASDSQPQEAKSDKPAEINQAA